MNKSKLNKKEQFRLEATRLLAGLLMLIVFTVMFNMLVNFPLDIAFLAGLGSTALLMAFVFELPHRLLQIARGIVYIFYGIGWFLANLFKPLILLASGIVELVLIAIMWLVSGFDSTGIVKDTMGFFKRFRGKVGFKRDLADMNGFACATFGYFGFLIGVIGAEALGMTFIQGVVITLIAIYLGAVIGLTTEEAHI